MRNLGNNRSFATGCATVAATAAALLFGAAPAQAVTCDKVAATNGSDSNPGTVERPLLTANRLVHSLAPGQTGCLRGGLYAKDQEIKLETASITLTSYPGERATVRGRFWVTDAAPDSIVSNLDLDGRNDRGLPSPTINGDRVTLVGNDITNYHDGICVSVGSPHTWGRAQDTVIENNRIHDCGTLPATNYDHGIYVNSADRTIIRNNLIYDNADRGIQLYPDAQNSHITGNVIDGNGQGVIFGGSEDSASSNNVVENNVITNSKIRDNIESSWGGPVGNGNVARNNCVGGGDYDEGDGGILDGTTAQLGFNASANLVGVPKFANADAGDFTLPADDPCAAILAGAPKSQVIDEPPVVTIEPSKKKVRKFSSVRLRGSAPGADSVTLVIRRQGEWHKLGTSKTRSSGKYSMRVRLRQSGRETIKAVAGGLRDSRAVKVRVKDRRNRH